MLECLRQNFHSCRIEKYTVSDVAIPLQTSVFEQGCQPRMVLYAQNKLHMLCARNLMFVSPNCDRPFFIKCTPCLLGEYCMLLPYRFGTFVVVYTQYLMKVIAGKFSIVILF
jgi:hypothetical protein